MLCPSGPGQACDLDAKLAAAVPEQPTTCRRLAAWLAKTSDPVLATMCTTPNSAPCDFSSRPASAVFALAPTTPAAYNCTVQNRCMRSVDNKECLGNFKCGGWAKGVSCVKATLPSCACADGGECSFHTVQTADGPKQKCDCV